MEKTQILDRDGQPLNTAFNRARNRRKAYRTLYGMCAGLHADRKLCSEDVLFLDTWLREHELLREDPDFVDILDITTDILADQLITHEELEDLMGQLETLLECGLPPRGLDDSLQHLHGLLLGVKADRRITDEEVILIRNWFNQNMELAEYWPANIIYDHVDRILADGVIEDEERREILDVLDTVVGGDHTDDGMASGASCKLPVEPVKDLAFVEKSFCFTGKFGYGSRKQCEAAVVSRGGIAQSNVTKVLNYLVIGAFASRDWIHEPYGRKIEKAVAYKSEGTQIVIVSEEDWVLFL